MNFREEYKNQAEVINPSQEAMERMADNIMEHIKAPAKKAIPFRKITYIGGAVAACAVITVGAFKVLPAISGSIPTSDRSNDSALCATEDITENEASPRMEAAADDAAFDYTENNMTDGFSAAPAEEIVIDSTAGNATGEIITAEAALIEEFDEVTETAFTVEAIFTMECAEITDSAAEANPPVIDGSNPSAGVYPEAAPECCTTETEYPDEAAAETCEAGGDEEWKSFIEAGLRNTISESNCVVKAEFISVAVTDSGAYEYCFKPLTTYKGEIPYLADGLIQVRCDNPLDFTEGTYILPLVYRDSVYFEYPYYNVNGRVVIHVNEDGSIPPFSIREKEYSFASEEEFLRCTSDMEDTSRQPSDYIRSTDLNDIIENSQIIVKVKIASDPLRTGYDRGLYSCDVIEVYKGDVPHSFDCCLWYDSVVVGGEVFLLLTKESYTSVYHVSSKNSIYGVEEEQIITALEKHGYVITN